MVFYTDGPTSTVTVVDPPGGSAENRAILVNGKSDGALFSDYTTMALTALIPALMAERVEKSFVVGYGTGVTTGELAALDSMRTVDVAEISHGVIQAAPLFEDGNLAASTSPKVSIRRGDAYRTLLQSREKYDIIISEPSNPWVVGVEMLYSREFLEAARERLTPGGVYAQWFHSYESDSEVVALVLRTYASVFPHVSVWYTFGADMLLLGFDRVDRAFDVEALEERFARSDFAAGFARTGIENFAQFAAHELLPLGTLHALEQPGEIHSLRHPLLSYRAARAFFRGRLGNAGATSKSRAGADRDEKLVAPPPREGQKAASRGAHPGSRTRELSLKPKRTLCDVLRALVAPLPRIADFEGTRSLGRERRDPGPAATSLPRSSRR